MKPYHLGTSNPVEQTVKLRIKVIKIDVSLMLMGLRATVSLPHHSPNGDVQVTFVRRVHSIENRVGKCSARNPSPQRIPRKVKLVHYGLDVSGAAVGGSVGIPPRILRPPGLVVYVDMSFPITPVTPRVGKPRKGAVRRRGFPSLYSSARQITQKELMRTKNSRPSSGM